MGQKISDADMDNVTTFAAKVVSLAKYRKTLYGYLVAKMGIVAPNLGALIGEVVGARLISHVRSSPLFKIRNKVLIMSEGRKLDNAVEISSFYSADTWSREGSF